MLVHLKNLGPTVSCDTGLNCYRSGDRQPALNCFPSEVADLHQLHVRARGLQASSLRVTSSLSNVG